MNDRAAKDENPKLTVGTMFVWAVLLVPASLLLLLSLSSVGLPWTFLAGLGLVLIWGALELVRRIRRRRRGTDEPSATSGGAQASAD